MYFSLRKNIFNHRNNNCFFFFNNNIIFFMINIYSDEYQSALKYLKDTEANIWNVFAMAGNFNIKGKDWDSSYLFYLSYSNSLIEVTDSFDLKLSSPVYQISMYYSDNPNNMNFVIDLIFLRLNLVEMENYFIFTKILTFIKLCSFNCWHLYYGRVHLREIMYYYQELQRKGKICFRTYKYNRKYWYFKYTKQKLLKLPFKNMQEFQNLFDINSLNISISLNIPKYSCYDLRTMLFKRQQLLEIQSLNSSFFI